VNNEYAVGNFRIRFETQARRRWFVALVYTALAVFMLAALFLSHKDTNGAWFTASCGILCIALWIVFSSVAGDLHARGDEREVHRRDHAHFRAYYVLGFFLFCAFIAGSFRGSDPITPHLPLALRGYLMQLQFVLLLTTALLYGTLPSAILLWTEPDMDV
jgi:hypothetical protein